MIRLKELFRLQNLKNLRVIAGQEGMERTVTAAVLLEYDPSRMQLPDFYRGDLVVTTLAYARGDSRLVTDSLQALLGQGVAGLLIKTAYFSELPAGVVLMANRLGTPLFLFDETYIEEVIVEVTELIRGKRHFAGYEAELDALMRGGLTADQVKEKVRRIDPVITKTYRLMALYPQDRLTGLSDKFYALMTSSEEIGRRYVCMEWHRMLIVLCHEDDNPARIEGAPELTIEILSKSSRTKDCIIKLNKYMNAGVKEYWIIDPFKMKVLIYTFEEDDSPEVYSFDDMIPVGISGGKCVIDFSKVRDAAARYL